ncbi:MAG: CheR family methyltransferase [Thermodesulfovibrionales bacterium]
MNEDTLIHLNNSISKWLGIHFPDNRLNELQKAIQVTSKQLKIKNPDELCLRIISNTLSDTEKTELIRHLTIGETYFLRDPQVFKGLKSVILPDIIKQKGFDDVIKIVTVGCSTGEEPYSIAITINRSFPYLKTKIIGLDINEESIKKAISGIYTKWSFRKSPKWLMESYFTKNADGTYEINDKIKQMVEFRKFNIADKDRPFHIAFPATDIVFCRNVIMYFSEDVRRQIAKTIYLSLNDKGWLVVSPTEASHRIFSQFSTINTTGAIFYKKSKQITDTTLSKTETLKQEPIHQEKIKQTHYPHIKIRDDVEPSISSRDNQRDNITDILDSAIKKANMGRFDEAERLLLDIVRIDNLNIDTYLLLASIAEERGDFQNAEYAIKKVIYINPNHPVAYFRLGNLMLKLGRRHDARKAFESALSILKTLDSNDVLHGAEDLNTQRLVDICQAMIREIEVE